MVDFPCLNARGTCVNRKNTGEPCVTKIMCADVAAHGNGTPSMDHLKRIYDDSPIKIW